MNARTEPELLQPHVQPLVHLSNTQLDALEEETIFILREVAASFERPTLLFSGGKDSLVLLKCAEKAFGANVAIVMRNAATNVQEVVVPNAGHWLMEEAPAATIAAVQDFLATH